MRDILRMVMVLSLICACSGAILVTLKKVTKPLIEAQVLTYVQGPALLKVVGEHDNDPIKERKTVALESGDVIVFPVIRDGELAGVALETFAPGYSGNIGVMVGFDLAEDNLMGIGVTTQTETPGLGTRVAEPAFTKQFKALDMDKVALSANGGSVNAISGATISSKATTVAVQKAVSLYNSGKDTILAAFGQ